MTRVQPHEIPLVFGLIDKGVSLSLVIYIVANHYYDREASVRYEQVAKITLVLTWFCLFN